VDVFQNLLTGFSTALQPVYLLYAFAGCVLGTIVGVLPGLGPLGAMAILLSFTMNLDVMGAMILFAGIYYGAMYGGSTTSILLNIPGEAASVVTCLDGYQMARKGRAGAALTVAAVGSFVAGTISIFGLMLAASALSTAALKFGPPEFFAIGVCGLTVLIRVSAGSALKSIIMVLLGMSISTVGLDVITGVERFTFGSFDLGQGVDFLPVAMGLFGIAEVLHTAADRDSGCEKPLSVKLMDLLPTRSEWRRSWGPILRGSLIGFPIGLIPGPSPVISTFVSYIAEKKLSKHPEEFGKGAIEGVAGPESANNAAVGGAYVPLLALGVPFSPVMAVVLGALLLHNITPGPNLIKEQPQLFWGVIGSMYIGNIMLLFLNVFLVKAFASIVRVPQKILLPIIVVLCWVGVFSVSSSYVDLMVMMFFGILGFLMRKLGFDPAPMVLATILGPIIEASLRQSLIISAGDVGAVIFRPICLFLYLLTLAAILLPPALKAIRKASW
jgi:putative tricarboxylic transport membrane protein